MLNMVVAIVVMVFVSFVAALVNTILEMAEERIDNNAAEIIMEEYEGYTRGV